MTEQGQRDDCYKCLQDAGADVEKFYKTSRSSTGEADMKFLHKRKENVISSLCSQQDHLVVQR